MKRKIIPLIFSLLPAIGLTQTTESDYDNASYPSCSGNVHGRVSAHMDCSTGIVVTSFDSDGGRGTVIKGLVSSTDHVLITPGHSFVRFVSSEVPISTSNNHDHTHHDHHHRDETITPPKSHKTTVGVPPPPPPPPPTGGRMGHFDNPSKAIALVADSKQNLINIVTDNKDINSLEVYNSHGNLILSRKIKTKSDLTISSANLRDRFYIVKLYGYKDEIIIKKFINKFP